MASAEPTDLGTLVASLERRVLDGLQPYVVFGAALLVMFGITETRAHRASAPLVFMFLALVAIALGAAGRFLALERRKLFFVIGFGLLTGAGLVQRGPLLGVGVFLVLTILLTTFFYETYGAIVISVSATVLIAVTAIGSLQGWLHPSYSPTLAIEWARLVLTTSLGSFACAYLAQRIVGSMRASLATEKAARSAEAEARRSRERTLKERERLLRQSMASQKLESVGRLAGGVAHDFNNTLMVIRAGVDYLKRTVTDDEQREVIAEVIAAVEAAASTSKQLLALGAPRPEDAGSCSPATILERFAASIKRMLPETILVDVDAGPTPEIPLSGPALEQVLLNLVINARDAMPTGGTVTLAAKHEPDDGTVVISVRDEGAGISDAVKARIFEPFFTTKKDRGTGLGLPMVWGVVTHAGGKIEIDSTLGQGSCFTLRFPAVALAPRHSTPRTLPKLPIQAQRRVLLLEDQPEVLRAVSRMLATGGYEVAAFDRAAPAAASLESARYDVLLTDVVVPGGGVAELIASFRQRHPDAPVLVCSGHFEEEMVKVGIESGDYHFLRKPFAVEELLSTLASLVEPPRRADTTPAPQAPN